MSEYNADICFTQDIYCNKRGVSTRYVPPDVPSFNLFFSSESDNIPKAAIYVSDKFKHLCYPKHQIPIVQLVYLTPRSEKY